MSAPEGFDPTVFNGKDRSELVAIATQLGQKPPARAKKADILALIMRLVGADGTDGAPAEGAGEAPAGAQADLFDAAASTESPDERKAPRVQF